jgi:hypothetical protein
MAKAPNTTRRCQPTAFPRRLARPGAEPAGASLTGAKLRQHVPRPEAREAAGGGRESRARRSVSAYKAWRAHQERRRRRGDGSATKTERASAAFLSTRKLWGLGDRYGGVSDISAWFYGNWSTVIVNYRLFRNASTQKMSPSNPALDTSTAGCPLDCNEYNTQARLVGTNASRCCVRLSGFGTSRKGS